MLIRFSGFYQSSSDTPLTYFCSLGSRASISCPAVPLSVHQLDCFTAPSYLFYNSFLPSSIRDWNRLNPDIRNAGTLDAFKFKLNQNLPVIPKHYYSGIRKNQIWHTRIRTGCSSHKNDLFLKNIIDSPLCTCNSGEVENAYHFFFICQLYNHLRVELRHSIAQYCDVTLNVLLRGDERLSTNINSIIFEAVHKYIQKSKRF